LQAAGDDPRYQVVLRLSLDLSAGCVIPEIVFVQRGLVGLP